MQALSPVYGLFSYPLSGGLRAMLTFSEEVLLLDAVPILETSC